MIRTRYILLLLLVLLLGSGFYYIFNTYGDDLNTITRLSVMEELNILYFSTPNNMEFVGFVGIKDNAIEDFELVGYKNLDTGEIEVTNPNAEYTNYSIHSHPSGSCFLSPQDKNNEEDIVCIMCDINKIRCYDI